MVLVDSFFNIILNLIMFPLRLFICELMVGLFFCFSLFSSNSQECSTHGGDARQTRFLFRGHSWPTLPCGCSPTKGQGTGAMLSLFTAEGPFPLSLFPPSHRSHGGHNGAAWWKSLDPSLLERHSPRRSTPLGKAILELLSCLLQN